MRLATLFDRQLAGSMYSVPKKSARVLWYPPVKIYRFGIGFANICSLVFDSLRARNPGL
jgi:hypothetical protein